MKKLSEHLLRKCKVVMHVRSNYLFAYQALYRKLCLLKPNNSLGFVRPNGLRGTLLQCVDIWLYSKSYDRNTLIALHYNNTGSTTSPEVVIIMGIKILPSEQVKFFKIVYGLRDKVKEKSRTKIKK